MALRHAKKLITFLERQKQSISPLLILTHNFPDPDAIASAFALKYMLEKVFDVEATIAYDGIIGRMENRALVNILRIPIHKLKPRDFKRYDHVALVDTQPAFENNAFPKKRKAVLVIDQHLSVTKPQADCAIIDTDCGATSVLVAEALLLLKMEMPSRIATALAYGILTDTMNFHRAHGWHMVQIYLQLMQHCDLKALAKIQNPVRSRKFFSTLGKAIQSAMVNRGIIMAHLGEVENPDLVGHIADFLMTYRRMTCSFCTGRYKGKLHVSLRLTKTNRNAGEMLRDIILERGRAGGHGLIAGGSIPIGDNEEPSFWRRTEEELSVRLFKRMRIPTTGEPYFPFRE